MNFRYSYGQKEEYVDYERNDIKDDLNLKRKPKLTIIVIETMKLAQEIGCEGINDEKAYLLINLRVPIQK